MEESLARLQTAAARWGVELSREQLEQVRRYVEDLLSANKKTNLTAETDPAALVLRHVADAMAGAALLRGKLGAAPRILDLGSGGGLIGINLKIAWPEAEVTLLESVERKYRFLNGTVLRSGLKGLRVLRARAGGPWAGTHYSAVTARAVAALPQVIAIAAPLLRPGGFLLDYQSRPPQPNDAALHKALAAAGGRLVESFPYRLPAETKERYLALFSFQGGRHHADA